MFAELADVVLRSMDEARLASAHEVEAQHIEAGRVDDSAVVAQAPLAIKHRQVQPAEIRMKARRPDDRADAAVGQIERQRRLGCEARWHNLLSRLGRPYALERCGGLCPILHHPAVDRVEQSAELEISHRAMVAERAGELRLAIIDSYQAANQRDTAFG